MVVTGAWMERQESKDLSRWNTVGEGEEGREDGWKEGKEKGKKEGRKERREGGDEGWMEEEKEHLF